MNKTTIYLPADTQHRLQEVALRTDRSQAAIIREAVERYLDMQDEVPLRSIGTLTKKSLTSSNQELWLQEHWEAEQGSRTATSPRAR